MCGALTSLFWGAGICESWPIILPPTSSPPETSKEPQDGQAKLHRTGSFHTTQTHPGGTSTSLFTDGDTEAPRHSALHYTQMHGPTPLSRQERTTVVGGVGGGSQAPQIPHVPFPRAIPTGLGASDLSSEVLSPPRGRGEDLDPEARSWGEGPPPPAPQSPPSGPSPQRERGR